MEIIPPSLGLQYENISEINGLVDNKFPLISKGPSNHNNHEYLGSINEAAEVNFVQPYFETTIKRSMDVKNESDIHNNISSQDSLRQIIVDLAVSRKEIMTVEGDLVVHNCDKIMKQSGNLPTIRTSTPNLKDSYLERDENNKSIISEPDFDHGFHSKQIFFGINDLRMNPQKYMLRLQEIIKKIDLNQHILDLSEENHIKILLPDSTNPSEIVEFLRVAPSRDPILWSIDLVHVAYAELKYILNPSMNTDIVQHSNTLKILADFILDPVLTLLIIILTDPRNFEVLFSDSILEGSVITMCPNNSSKHEFHNNGKTFLYFRI